MASSSDQLHLLAEACGLASQWRDVEGREQRVSDASMATILQALGHDTSSDLQVRRSLSANSAQARGLPKLLVADAGVPLALPSAARRAAITGEDGITRQLPVEGGVAAGIHVPGYYDLEIDGQATRLAVAPVQCPLPHTPGRRPWGVSLQIPALRGAAAAEFGSFAELEQAVPGLARRGADAIAINPVHALFPGHGAGFSPYSPSSRLFLNGAMGAPELVGLPALPQREGGPMIDWDAALPRRLAELRALFATLDPSQHQHILAECAEGGDALRRHAQFDALDCHFRPHGAHGWQDWPVEFREPGSPAVARFAAENQAEIEFHLFTQWLARKGLDAVQRACRSEGMATGLIGDLAVGVDPSGSDAWTMREAMLRGLTIGAPPDPLGPLGQNWSITGFSPEGLRQSGYAPWIAMLRAAFAGCGGLRIDHAFGLARLWVIPEGGTSADGAYLSYPFDDLIRLAALEAHRSDAFVIAEDLGTAPHGFTAAVTARRMPGMRVLWFERAADHGFIGARDYEPLSVAMTGTHDTPTVAGWWTGRDLDWAARLGRLPPGVDRTSAEEIRDWDRGLLWSTIGHGQNRPAPEDPQPVVDAAVAHIARAPALLAIVPLEDLLGEEEQPNLPGTVAEHPNWRRRWPLPTEILLGEDQAEARCASLRELRG
ncbi:MAG: 4-alpha-glucanotransferase [Erythrobacter sp.]